MTVASTIVITIIRITICIGTTTSITLTNVSTNITLIRSVTHIFITMSMCIAL